MAISKVISTDMMFYTVVKMDIVGHTVVLLGLPGIGVIQGLDDIAFKGIIMIIMIM